MDNFPNFKHLKGRVSIEEVAYALGYRVDKKAGIGRYFEMVLGNEKNKIDTIIIRNTNDKSSQTFFRRNGSKGDVITFIKENLNSFVVEGKDDWQKVGKVLSRFANMPEPVCRDLYSGRHIASKTFDATQYQIMAIDCEHLPPLFSERCISNETVRAFSPFISLVQNKKLNHPYYNIAFPYTTSLTESIQGYELRGASGFKSKAAGTNSSTASWVADFSRGNTHGVTEVFIFESALDAMAFYQINKNRIGQNVAFASIGGTFSDGQILDIIKRFPNARLCDCFDNDLAGRTYGLRLISLVENKKLKISNNDGQLRVAYNGKEVSIDIDRPLGIQLYSEFSIRSKVGNCVAPTKHKDWNDCLIYLTLLPTLSNGKRERDLNLAAQRQSKRKI